MKITQEIINECFFYNKNTGILCWKERPAHHFGSNMVCKRWNKRYSGKKAGTIHKNQNGKKYITISIFNKRFFAHRVIWLFVYGVWPKNEIDHINGNSIDNRLNNLRHVKRSENNQNLRISKRNKSGIIGVRKYAKNKVETWVADIGYKGKSKTIGFFRTKEEAITARKKAEQKYWYK